MTPNPVTQAIRHVFVSNDAEAAAWSQLPEQITDALTGAYVLMLRPATPLIATDIKRGRPVLTADGLTLPHDAHDFDPEHWRTYVAQQEETVQHALMELERDRAVLAHLEARQAEQDAKKQMDVKIRHEQRHEALRRILPEAAAANNLPAWDDLDLLQQRAVDQVVDLTNVVQGRATAAEADRVALGSNAGVWDPIYLRWNKGAEV